MVSLLEFACKRVLALEPQESTMKVSKFTLANDFVIALSLGWPKRA